MPFARLKLLLVCTLIASTAVFAIGVAVERSHEETSVPGEVTRTDEGTGGEGGESAEGGSPEGSGSTESTATVEHTDSDAVFLGVDLESWWLVTIAVVASLGLALAIWFRPIRPVFALTIVLAVVFTAFDLAEVSHQVDASEARLVAIAAVVALLHLATAGLGVAAFRSPEAA
jgi:hypothetical protein